MVLAKSEHRCADFAEIPLSNASPDSCEKNKIAASSIPIQKPIHQKKDKRHRLVWSQGGTLEGTLAVAGTLLGCTKRDIGKEESCSRLCRKDTSLLLKDVDALISASEAAADVKARVGDTEIT